MDRFNTPWRVTSAAIYTTPTDSRVYGTLDIDATAARAFIDRRRGEGVKITMVHMTTAALARAMAFDAPEMNCFIRSGDEIKAAQNKYLLNRIPWPLRRPAFRLLKWITVDMGIEIGRLGLSAHSFGSFVVSDIGSFGLNTGMTALMPAAKVPCVVVLGKVEEKPVVRGSEIVIRTVLPLTGTFDHRIVDGMQIGKLARGLKRAFRTPEWLDEVPARELEDCIFNVR